ncbi:MAG TPA: AAA family ATPase, partial [Roseiarcus sp.]|nr:AAA family ATPase [Roseiarcus sp.]
MNVAQWLNAIDLGQYEPLFREHEIEVNVLPDLAEADLEKIGVPLGHRKRLMRAIAALSAGGTPPTAKPASAAPKAAPVSAERRPITVMFCDLVGSTSLAATLDVEDWHNLVGAYLDEASASVTGLGGHVLKKLGDGLMALFGYPQAQENDAERAVRAALAIQRGLEGLNARNAQRGAPALSARIGLDSGPVVVDSSGEVFGETPNIAARVQGLAEPGSVLVTANVQRQVAGLFVAEDKGARELKGAPEPVNLFRIVRASGAGRRSGARSLTPLVGREEDLSLLVRRWERAQAGDGQLVMIVGEPGLGKSRLIEEFRGKLADTPHTWAEWSASQLLQNTPLHPFADWGRQRFGGADVAPERRLADLENTLTLIGLDPTEYAPLIAPLVDIPVPEARAAKFPPDELRRRQLAAITAWYLAGARTQPAVLAFEDLHWADPTSLDLLRSLAERGAQAPLLMVATTRPEFRPDWSLRPHHSVLSLSPLDRAQVVRMVGEIASRHGLSKEVVEGVNQRTGGVPLFVEEVTRLLLERGEQGGSQAIPPTLQQSLAARLDRLGEARETAQIGAVLGREFSYRLLRDVAGLDEPALHAALERLAEADILFAEGAPPQATYRFKHALIQDAAYDSLLKSRRQPLHRRAAEFLRDSGAEPEAIAHHFTEAGFDDLAIEWWGKAGDQALRRSAFQEAIAHLGKAIAMADKATGAKETQTTEVDALRLKLQSNYGQAVAWARGFSADETKTAFALVKELAVAAGDSSGRAAAHYGVWVGHQVRAEMSLARETAETFLSEMRGGGPSALLATAHRCLGMTAWLQGHYGASRANLEAAIAMSDTDREREGRKISGQDTSVIATSYLAAVMWQIGEAARSGELKVQALQKADAAEHLPTQVNAIAQVAILEVVRGDIEAARAAAERMGQLAAGSRLPLYSSAATIILSWCSARSVGAALAAERMRTAIAEHIRPGTVIWLPVYTGRLAELEAEGWVAGPALATIGEALGYSRSSGENWTASLLHRIRGDILAKTDPENPERAEEAYLAAIAVAKEQGARSFGLRAALSLAKLYQSTARPADAHAVLAPALEGFAATPEMPEIAEAQALLAALAQTNEVKADAAKRQRRLQLQTAYGNALIAARGYGAPETTEAFDKVRESAAGTADALERLTGDYGLWVGSIVRGELSAARTHAATCISDVEVRPDSPEAGIAHRVAGTTHWCAGEWVEAREHLERALALFQPGRDDDLAFRFGQDAVVATMLNLAHVSWPMGDIGRAVTLVRDAEARLAGLTHVGTRAYGRWFAAAFELMRGDPSRAAQDGVELARLAREYDLPFYRAFSVFLERLAGTQSDKAGGLEGLRRGAELLREQNPVAFDGLSQIALAEAEARAGDVDRAVAILDETLATCERTGYRTYEAELHRVRGEMLLKRDRANTASAEEAFLKASAVAGAQGTRSFGLRAALALAKLYQSTGRHIEAHSVLAASLEGFAPTPEMPEIAEALVLLGALAKIEHVREVLEKRQARAKMHLDYARAVQWGKGWGAEEARAAVERAHEFAAPTPDHPDYWSLTYGRFAVALLRGEFRAALEIGETYLRQAEVEGRPDHAVNAR